jgi:hypothetical protein
MMFEMGVAIKKKKKNTYCTSHAHTEIIKILKCEFIYHLYTHKHCLRHLIPKNVHFTLKTDPNYNIYYYNLHANEPWLLDEGVHYTT